MTCPYCAEGIKDEVFVCPQCKRDLMFFKPVEQRLQAFNKELAALNECVTKMAARLDRHELGEGEDSSDAAEVPKVKKPTIWRMLLIVLLQFVLTIVIFVVVLAFVADVTPKSRALPTTSSTSDGSEQQRILAQAAASEAKQEEEEFGRRLSILRKISVASFSALPIVLGLWIGRRWRGRNLKRYLLVGFLCGAVDGAILLAVAILITVSGEHFPGLFTFAALFILIDLFRCLFGFATGGLLGDWLEKRRYPQLYSRGFSDLLALGLSTHGDRSGRFGRMTRGVGSFTSSVGPLVPLLGVVITSVFGFYAARAAQSAKDLGEKNKPAASATPTPQPPAR